MRFLVVKKRSSAAFAIMEVIVAAVITGITFFSLYAGLSSGFGMVSLARENLRGTQILQEKMETIRLYTWEQLNQPGFVPATFLDDFLGSTGSLRGLVYTGSVTIVSAPVAEVYAADLKQITIKVQWKSGKALRTREMMSFIAKNGLQSYIY
jgi:hypothetical protein